MARSSCSIDSRALTFWFVCPVVVAPQTKNEKFNSGGSSGAFLYYSSDSRFIVKTVELVLLCDFSSFPVLQAHCAQKAAWAFVCMQERDVVFFFDCTRLAHASL